MATKHNGLSPWSQRFILSENRGQGSQRFFSLSSPLRGSLSLSRRKTLRITSGTRVRAYWRRNIMTADFSRLAPVPWTDTIWNLAYVNTMLWNGRKFSFPRTHFFNEAPSFQRPRIFFPSSWTECCYFWGWSTNNEKLFLTITLPFLSPKLFPWIFYGKIYEINVSHKKVKYICNEKWWKKCS